MALHEFNNRRREIKLVSFSQHISLIQLVLHHELGQVSHDLGCRGDLDKGLNGIHECCTKSERIGNLGPFRPLCEGDYYERHCETTWHIP